MAPTPDWVKQLKPSGPQGSELLAAERAKSNVPVEKLNELLLTKDIIQRKEKILGLLKAEKVFDKSQNYFSGRMERFERALAREKRLQLMKREHNWSFEEYRTAAELVGEPGPYGLHESMFKVRRCHSWEANKGLTCIDYHCRPGYSRAARELWKGGRCLQDHWLLRSN
jgi:acyl-CoA oxidase